MAEVGKAAPKRATEIAETAAAQARKREPGSRNDR